MKKALITGASGGIGLEIARRLSQQHYQLTQVARNEQKLKSVQEQLGREAHQILVADLTIKEDIEKVSSTLLKIVMIFLLIMQEMVLMEGLQRYLLENS
ncbi:MULTISPECIES: SDR family NAD(P)-dependent oxidoreductase [Sphingobacterium]|uniref:SDR family NAD(P)-dependent oxidoreductase n=1 Tax=Sphingobacterium TaxID=28453 RepID=UPI00257E0AEE|nr:MULTISPECIES: SDR family NAD(P)-dependent oxidoreductase [Sphingobacterium]